MPPPAISTLRLLVRSIVPRLNRESQTNTEVEDMEAIFRALQKDPSCWAHDAELKYNLQDIDSLVRKTRIARLGTIENVNVLTDQSHLSDERSALSDICQSY